jgi:hypothetical protein
MDSTKLMSRSLEAKISFGESFVEAVSRIDFVRSAEKTESQRESERE